MEGALHLRFRVVTATTPSLQRQLLYDADCAFCQRWVSWARKRGAEPAVQFLPCQTATELRALARIEIEECGRHAMLIETDRERIRTLRGAAAICGVMRLLPGVRNSVLRIVARACAFPGANHLAEIGYRFLARHRDFFSKSSCGLKRED